MKKLLFSIILCITLYLPTQSMPKDATEIGTRLAIGISSFVGLGCFGYYIAGPYILKTMVFFQQLYLNLLPYISLYDHTSDSRFEDFSDDKVEEFIKDIAQKQGLNDTKIFTLKDYVEGYFSIAPNNIVLGKKSAKDLSFLLNIDTNSLESEEKNKLNRHKCSIYHEITHLKRKSLLKKTLISHIGGAACSFFQHKLIEKYSSNNSAKFFGYATLPITMIYCQSAISHFYSKYIDEPACDEGIPNDLDLLRTNAQYYKDKHKKYLEPIKKIKEAPLKNIFFKDFFNGYLFKLALYLTPIKLLNESPLACDLIIHAKDDHPSDLRRALKFEERIKKLESNTESK